MSETSDKLSRRQVLKLGAGAVAGMALNPLPFGLRLQSGPKRIYIAPDDHTDYLWAGDENAYRDAFLNMIDYYLNLADTTASNPSDFQSRWNCDGSFWVWVYERNKPTADYNRLIERIRDGHISVPLNALVLCLGGAPTETVLRGMYYAGKLERRHNLRLPLAICMENQTLPYGLGTLWAGSGARYSWKGICGCASRVSAASRDREIYWWNGADGSRILMKWNSMIGANTSIGGYAEARDPRAAVDYLDTDSTFIARYPYRVLGAFGAGWDDLQTLTNQFVAAAQEKTNANRRVIVSNEVDFFTDFEATYGSTLQSFAGSYGNDWDLDWAMLAEVTAKVKRSSEKLRGAEALASLVALANPSFMNGRATARDQAWMSMGLFWEHNMAEVSYNLRGFGNQRTAFQRARAAEIASYVDTLQNDAVQALGTLIPTAGTNARFFVFNPLSWARSDAADLPYADTATVHVVEVDSGQEVPSQIYNFGGTRYLRILAQNVPPVGYKGYEIRSGAGAGFGNAATTTTNTLENAFYRLTIGTNGAINSWLDKTRSNRQFAQSIGGRAINDLGSSGGSIAVENAGAVSVTMRVTASAPQAHTTRITLLRGSNRVEIRNEITQNFGGDIWWSFGFNLTQPDVYHEELGAILRARLLANGGHYAANNARYDWLTLNHFADMAGSDGVGVTLSNADGSFMRVGSSTPTSLDTSTAQISVLVGGKLGQTGFTAQLPDQGGDTFFLQRFALRTRASYSAADAMRFALEHQNPLIAGSISGSSPSYPESSYSLVTMSNPNVLLWALKPADDDDDLIARVWNLSTTTGDLGLGFPQHFLNSARVTTHIETPLGNAALVNGQLAESINGQQLRTFSLNIAAGPNACAQQDTAISDQELLAALQAVSAAPLSIALVVLTQAGINIYASSSGVMGVAMFNVHNADGLITLELSSVTTPTGAPAAQSLTHAISTHLPPMVVQALDSLLAARYGANFDLESVVVHQNSMDVCIRV
jgi:alpha-mannosidase